MEGKSLYSVSTDLNVNLIYNTFTGIPRKMFDYTSCALHGPAKLTQNELLHLPKRAFVGHQEILHNIVNYWIQIKISKDVIMVITVQKKLVMIIGIFSSTFSTKVS